MENRYLDSQVFNEIAGLDRLRSGAKQNDEEALKTVAKQFESIFTNMWLKSMREANELFESDSPFNSRQTKFYQQMADQQLATDLSSKGSLGLADLIVQQLSPAQSRLTPASVLREQASAISAGATAPEQPEGFSLQTKQGAGKALHPDEQQPMRIAAERKRIAATKEAQSDAAANLVEQGAVNFSSPESFVSELLPMAERAGRALNIDPAILLAQAALETGWGEKVIRKPDGSSSNNLFNIKADQRWQGERAKVQTLEYDDSVPVRRSALFRAYDSLADSFDDLVEFLKESPRYQDALEKTDNPANFLHSIQQAGYATDPRYADKILSVLDRVKQLIN